MPSMWYSLLILGFTAGAVFASEITLPLSIKFGNNEVTFSEEINGLRYTIVTEDGSTARNTFLVEGSDLARSDPQYSMTDCTSDVEACVEIVVNDLSLVLRSDLSSQARSELWVTQSTNTSGSGITVSSCLELIDGVQWFGGPQTDVQIWPVQNARFNYTAYVPKEIVYDPDALTEPYWVSSQGTYFYVSPGSSVFIDQNNLHDGYLCLYSENVSPYRDQNSTSLEYWIVSYDDPRSAHEAAVEKFFQKPTGIPDERMIAAPIWSTWARYKIYVNETVVRSYANEILANGFNHSQLEIDDYWETCYGSLTFATTSDKFPNIKNLTDDLHALGFRVTLWVHPFINVECSEYYEIAQANGYFVRDVSGSIFTTWWQGENASVIDFTNEAAVEWYTARLTALQESAGIDSFKFDAGETGWLPEPAVLTGDVEESPAIYTTKYATAMAEFGSAIEIRTGWRTQNLPVFVRMLDKDSTWTTVNGLPTLITTLLVMNLAGYGLVLPDMVGGNGYIEGTQDTDYPGKELFVRWLQANTFMPSIQYSFVPWDYDNETIDICRTYTDLHEEYAPTIIEAMNAAVSNGTPVNPPVWWVDPTNSDAHNISDEYLLGEVILVAPVIVEGAITRDVFLPSGTWVDGNTHETYEGPTWIYDYPAPIDILPYFVEASYWESLGNEVHSGTFIPKSSLLVIYTTGIFALVNYIMVK